MGGTVTVKRKPKVIIGEGVPLVYDTLDKEEHGFY